MISFPGEWAHCLFRLIGDGGVQQLNIHDYYDLGKKVDQMEREIAKVDAPVLASSLAWPLFLLRWNFLGLLQEPCALLPASQRAARAVITAIEKSIGHDIDAIFNLKDEMLQPYQLNQIATSITDFETVLKNDMPEMSTFAVAQIGIYRTEDLINKAYFQITEDLRPYLMPLALSDVTEAGKCLAFRVPTAAAFHLSRAIETGMNQYYEALTDKPFELKDAARNWGTKTNALVSAGADGKITEYLVHIRKAYRNPITHPDVILEPTEAFNFFSQSIGVISMMLGEVKALEEKKQPMLPGLSDGLGGWHEAATYALGGVRHDNEENSLGLEAGTTAEDGSGKEG